MTTQRFRPSADAAVAALLLLLAGFVDAIAFVVLNGNFVSFMSGNSTILSASVAAHAWSLVAMTGALIALFFCGAASGAALQRWGGQHASLWVVLAVTAAMTLGATVGSLGAITAGMLIICFGTGTINSALSTMSSVKGGLTYVTGTLVKSAQHLIAGLGSSTPWAWLSTFWMWLVFIAGALSGGFAHRALGVTSLWIAAALAAGTLLLRLIGRRAA